MILSLSLLIISIIKLNVFFVSFCTYIYLFDRILQSKLRQNKLADDNQAIE